MSTNRLTVVLSQTRSKNPEKQRIEEDIATALLLEPGIEFAIVPNVYDLSPATRACFTSVPSRAIWCCSPGNIPEPRIGSLTVMGSAVNKEQRC